MDNHSSTSSSTASQGTQLPNWLQFPVAVLARSPADRRITARFAVDPRFAVLSARDRRRQPSFDLWSQVFGLTPRVPNVQRQTLAPAEAGLTSLHDAHACYLGVKRPIGDDNVGSSVLAYVSKPTFYFEYVPDLVTVAHKTHFPDDLLFITYVKLAKEYSGGPMIPDGTVCHWGNVEGDTGDPLLPREHYNRFEKRLW